MLTVENDWIEYVPTAARRVAVRGGSACAQRVPFVADRPQPAVRALRIVEPPAPRRTVTGPLRLTRRGLVVLVVLPVLLALSGGLVVITAPGPAAAAQDRADRTVLLPHLVRD